MPTLFEEDVTREEDTTYRIGRDGPLGPPEGFPVGLGPPEPSLTEWGRKAVVIQLLDVNAIYRLNNSDEDRWKNTRYLPVGVQDAWQFGGGDVSAKTGKRSHAGTWASAVQQTFIDLSEIVLAKHTTTYWADSLEIRFFFDVVVEIRVGHWASKACYGEEGQCGMGCGMEYQEMTYSGRFLVQWASA